MVGIFLPPSSAGRAGQPRRAAVRQGAGEPELHAVRIHPSPRPTGQCGIRTVITSRRHFMEKIKLTPPGELIYLEDVAANPAPVGKNHGAAAGQICAIRPAEKNRRTGKGSGAGRAAGDRHFFQWQHRRTQGRDAFAPAGATANLVLVGWSANLGSTYAGVMSELQAWSMAQTSIAGTAYFGVSAMGTLASGTGTSGVSVFVVFSDSQSTTSSTPGTPPVRTNSWCRNPAR